MSRFKSSSPFSDYWINFAQDAETKNDPPIISYTQTHFKAILWAVTELSFATVESQQLLSRQVNEMYVTHITDSTD
jgi:hypothetical protein